MSHGTYLFLLESPADTGKAEVTSMFDYRYAHQFCDENNWYEVYYLARPGKDTVSYDPKNSSAPSYEQAIMGAWSVAIHDLALIKGAPTIGFGRDKPLEETYDTLKARGPRYLDWLIRNQVPARIRDSFHPGEKSTHAVRFTDLGFERYRRDALVEGYKRYGSSYVPPFAHYLCPPEDWRLFDLREETNSDDELSRLNDCAILAVDIHT